MSNLYRPKTPAPIPPPPKRQNGTVLFLLLLAGAGAYAYENREDFANLLKSQPYARAPLQNPASLPPSQDRGCDGQSHR